MVLRHGRNPGDAGDEDLRTWMSGSGEVDVGRDPSGRVVTPVLLVGWHHRGLSADSGVMAGSGQSEGLVSSDVLAS